MGRRFWDWAVPALLGLVIGGVGAAVLWFGGPVVAAVETSAMDLLFLRDGGPRLAARPAPQNIIVVQFDQHSNAALGRLPNYAEDMELYRALLDAGATVVADTRMIADAGDFESSPVRRLLDDMVATRAEGRLYRDIWMSTEWPEERVAEYRKHIAHNILNMHANVDGFFESRLYPPITLASDGIFETMPLVLTRRVRGEPLPEMQSVLDEVKRSGISAAWQADQPVDTPLPPGLRADENPRSPYMLGDLPIPWFAFHGKTMLVPPVGYWVAYDWLPDQVERVSFIDAAKPEFADKFKGRIVLIGYEFAIDPTADTYNTPTAGTRTTAVDVVAAALQTLLRGELMRLRPAWVILSTVVALALVAALIGGLLRPAAALVAILVLSAAYLVAMVAVYRSGWFVDLVVAPAAIFSAAVFGAGYRYWREIRAKSRIVDLFGRYVPKAVVSQLIQQRKTDALALGGVKREVTVLFADIRGFTTFAERVPPEEVIRQLNLLLKVMVEATFAHDGTVDKFIGDAILVLFNAPVDQADHALRAAQTAWAIQQGLRDHPSGLDVGIGIHRGDAIVGRVGTAERMEYTAVGSTVNLASRLCSAAGSRQIVVSEAVAELIRDEFELAPQPPLRVKGVEHEVATSQIVGRRLAN